MRTRDYGFALVSLLALVALWALFRPGFFISDDGLFHLYRLVALDAAFHAGSFYPRWFPDFAFGYGYPVLNFYSPLSYYLGEAFHLLGGGYIVSIKLAFGASLLLSALAMYFFARETLSQPAALLAALAYLYAPYHLADVYRRGALAESLAFVFFPFVLWACHRLIARQQAIYILLLAIGYAGLILVHNLSAMIFTPLLLVYGFFCFMLYVPRSMLHISRFKFHASRFTLSLVALLLALGLTAFYILPVRAEAPFAHLIYDVNSTGYQRHLAPLNGFLSPFLTYRYFPHQGVLADRPIGLVQAILSMASLAILWRRIQQRLQWEFLAFWTASTLVALGMTLDVSLPVWRLFQSLLSVVQYPWRFMALVDLSSAYLIGSLVTWEGGAAPNPQSAIRNLLLALTLAIPLMVNTLPNLPTPTTPLGDEELTVQRMWQEDYAAGQIGATWTAEYLPLTVQEERWAIPRPSTTPQVEVALNDVPILTLGEQRFLLYDMTVESREDFPLRLHAFYFPGWQGYVDGAAVTTYPSGRLGLVTVDIPPGRHVVRATFQDTPVRQAGAILSVLSLLLLVSVLVVIRRQAIVPLVVVLIILAALTGWHLRPHIFALQPAARMANLEDKVKLVGYKVGTGSMVQQTRFAPGDSVQVTLYWLTLQPMSVNYKVFVHLTDEAGQIQAQHDGDPVYGFTPTTRWLPGEIVADQHDFRLPSDLTPGRYILLAGMYEFETMRNLLPLGDEEAKRWGNRIRLGEVTVGFP